MWPIQLPLRSVLASESKQINFTRAVCPRQPKAEEDLGWRLRVCRRARRAGAVAYKIRRLRTRPNQELRVAEDSDAV